jgi:hypothetical protein
MAELAIARHLAAKDIDIAVSDMQDEMDLYDTSVKGCLMQRDLGQILSEVEGGHQETMARLRKKTSRARGIMSAVTSYGFGLRATNAAHDEATAEAQHAFVVSQIRGYGQVQLCLLEASKHLAGVQTAYEGIEQSHLEGVAVEVSFRSAREQLRRLVREGRAAVARAELRAERLDGYQYWLDATVRRAQRKIRHAKRMAYLGLLAVEHDLQMSIEWCEGEVGTVDCRAGIFSAQQPHELEAILGTLEQEVRARRIEGASANEVSEYAEVFSLRDELLALTDNSDLPDGYKQLGSSERFRLLLSDPQYALFTDAGVYAGQLIPFSLWPLWCPSDDRAATGEVVGSQHAIEVYGANRCAERIWSAALALNGADLFAAERDRFASFELWHSNKFASRLCSASPTNWSEAMQSVSYRPHVNLYRDPLLGQPAPVGAAAADARYTRVTLDAYEEAPTFDGPPGTYVGGNAVTTLSGYGLFGDYALFVPAGTLTEQLKLENLEDIRLRLEYVATTSSSLGRSGPLSVP